MVDLNHLCVNVVMKNTNDIVRDHRVHGVRIMPGVTFLDMIYRILKSKKVDLAKVELREVLFLEPVSTSEEYDQKIELTFVEKGAGYLVTARSQKIKEDKIISPVWEENLRCELYFTEEEAEKKKINIEQIKKNSSRVEDMDYAYQFIRQIDISHREFMKACGNLYFDEKRILAELTLSECAAKYLDYFYMHPAYLDSATLVQGFVVLQNIDFSQNVKASIPIYIHSFRSYEAMKDKIYVYIKNEGYKDGAIKDVMYFDIEVYNEKGEQIADFRKWGLKKIRSKELVQNLEIIKTEEKPEGKKLELKQETKKQKGKQSIEEIKTYLKEIVGSMLEREPQRIDETEGFYNLGLDSQDLLQIVSQIEERVKTTLYPTLLFEYANIKDLSQYLWEEYHDQFEKAEEMKQSKEIAMTEKTLCCYQPVWRRKQIIEKQAETFEHGLLYVSDRELLSNFSSSAYFTTIVTTGSAYEQNGKIITIEKEHPEQFERVFAQLKQENKIPGFVVHVDGKQEITQEIIGNTKELFYLVKQFIQYQLKGTGKYLFLAEKSDGSYQEAVEGLFHCLSNERPFSYKCIEVDTQYFTEAERFLKQELTYGWGKESSIRYEKGNRFVKVYEEALLDKNSKGNIRQGGNYIISGGSGGLGQHLAEQITAQGGNVILLGRSKENSQKLKDMKENEKVTYYSCDVTVKEEVERIARILKEEKKSLQGIFHLAGINRDGYLIQKEFADFIQVAEMKRKGMICLDQTFREEPLDFFVCYSSIAGVVGNPAQTDYAYGNGCMDSYMAKRRGPGKSISINWPLWKDGGMHGGARTEQVIKEKFGMEMLELEEGMSALKGILQAGYSNIVVVTGDKEKLDNTFVADREEETGKEENVSAREYSKKKESAVSASQMENEETDEVVIIGVSGRYPKADNLYEFWENLKEGKDCISKVPEDRWNTEEYEKITKKNWNKSVSKWGGFINDVDKFDPILFNIAPFQAELMDPQERIFLETAWETFEDAGYCKSELSGKNVGVYVGAMWLQYQLYNTESEVSTSTSASIANRVSYVFGLHGPSVAMDTMCSSALTALHMACQSLLLDDCDMALVGGVNISIHPDKYRLLAQGNFASSNGRCNTFAENGDGYVPSEGTGAILIKRRKDAERDGDRIYAVIKSTALNHGGSASGFTVPNPKAQEAVIEKAIQRSKIHPETIGCLEAHGTGTSLGDPIEVNALKKVYAKYTDKKQYCSIGSVKSNIGHAESAAGIAAITKMLLQMKYKTLVPSIHCEPMNPNLAFENSPFYVQKTLSQWKLPEEGVLPRRGAVSAFGAGGSNAHVILEEYLPKKEKNDLFDSNQNLIILSGQTKERLFVYAKILREFLIEHVLSTEVRDTKIEETLISYLRKYMEYPAGLLNADTCLMELALGQAEQMKLYEFIEEQYQVKITAEEVAGISDIAAMARYIKRRRIGKNGFLEKEEQEEKITLPQISYTLMAGREALKYRMAMVVSSVEELVENIGHFIKEETVEGLLVGNSLGDTDCDFSYEEGIRDPEKLAEAWVNGKKIIWKKFYKEGNPGLVSLPHYPFAKKRFFMGKDVEAEGKEHVKHKEPVLPKDYLGKEVTLEILEESIALITIQDKENNNSFTESVITGLMYYFHKVQKDSRIKAVIVTGDDRIFCMGGTQEQLLDISDEQLQFTDAPFLYRGMLECEIPVISAMQGHASGGGMLFGLYADIVVMSLESIYSAVFMKYGFTPGMGATFILEQKFGKNLATEMMFTAKSYQGSELQKRGASVLFEHKEKVVEKAVELARIIAQKPRNSLSILKKELSGRILDNLLSCIERENKMHKQTFTDSSVKEKIHHYYKPKDSEEKKLEDQAKQNEEERTELEEEQLLSVLANLDGMDLEQAAQLLEELYE